NKDNFNAGNYSIACCLDYLGKTSEAEEIFSNLYNDDDLEVDSLHNMASLAFKKNDLDRAEELYTQVIDTDEFHIESYISLIKIKLIQNKNEEANELLVKLSKIDPDNKELSYLEFEIAKSKGDKKLASDMYASMLYSFGN
ncbi:MAG: tetratricopeptide repeat protein, partial [Candidatus Sericytochromatia bacterium]